MRLSSSTTLLTGERKAWAGNESEQQQRKNLSHPRWFTVQGNTPFQGYHRRHRRKVASQPRLLMHYYSKVFNPPRIIFILRSFKLGGAERQAVLLANHFHSTGAFHVEVVAFEKGRAVPALLPSSITTSLIHLGGRRRLGRLLGTVGLTRHLRRRRGDILLPFTDWPNKAVGAVWPLTGAKACIWNQRDEGLEITGRFMEHRALKQVSWFVANSRSGKDFLSSRMRVDPAQISVISNCVLPLKPKNDRDHWRSRLAINPKTFVVTMVASLSRFKDHGTLLKAWPMVQEKYPDSVLLLAGRDGDRHSQVRETCSRLKSVHLLGEVLDIGGLLAASDTLVHSSFLEGTPNAVLEAMAAGLPVVATDIPGTRIAMDSGNRWLIPSRNSELLANTLLVLSGDPVLRRHVGTENRLRTLREFSPAVVSHSWLELFHPLLNNLRPQPGDGRD
jgi:glycosyltransferase involved in cell wall biosynthesis